MVLTFQTLQDFWTGKPLSYSWYPLWSNGVFLHQGETHSTDEQKILVEIWCGPTVVCGTRVVHCATSGDTLSHKRGNHVHWQTMRKDDSRQLNVCRCILIWTDRLQKHAPDGLISAPYTQFQPRNNTILLSVSVGLPSHLGSRRIDRSLEQCGQCDCLSTLWLAMSYPLLEYLPYCEL